MIARHLGKLAAEAAGAGADEPARRPDTVRVGDRTGVVEPLLELPHLGVEMGIERQLHFDEQRRDEDDTGAAVRREAASEVERMLGLFLSEQRHDDAPVADCSRPSGQPTHTALEGFDVGASHRNNW